MPRAPELGLTRRLLNQLGQVLVQDLGHAGQRDLPAALHLHGRQGALRQGLSVVAAQHEGLSVLRQLCGRELVVLQAQVLRHEVQPLKQLAARGVAAAALALLLRLAATRNTLLKRLFSFKQQ
jgi:hypothetical protein